MVLLHQSEHLAWLLLHMCNSTKMRRKQWVTCLILQDTICSLYILSYQYIRFMCAGPLTGRFWTRCGPWATNWLSIGYSTGLSYSLSVLYCSEFVSSITYKKHKVWPYSWSESGNFPLVNSQRSEPKDINTCHRVTTSQQSFPKSKLTRNCTWSSMAQRRMNRLTIT